jgi:steroid 5-alpha reductase family enzyme
MRGTLSARGVGWIAVAYGAAVLVAWLCTLASAELSPLWRAAIADVAATLVIFGFARKFDNSSFYDPYWSVAPPLLLLFWCSAYQTWDVRVMAIGLLVVLWSVRLTHNWARGWRGLDHVDWRHIELQGRSGRWYWLVDLFGIQLLPTILVFTACLPLWLLVSQSNKPWGALDVVWLVVGLGALWIEYRADVVLRDFRADPGNAGRVLHSDVWAWCRHPNYLGELAFWLALGMAGYSASGESMAWLGTGCLVALFLGVSVPMLEQRQMANKTEYRLYQATMPCLLPTGVFRRAPGRV